MRDVTERLTAALADRYRLERHIGEGGMATVYLAHDVKHDRKVALKVLRPELAALIGAERFLQEIRVTANLQHPHILPLHDSGEADGFLFYVMPYVEGESLRERLNREKQLGIQEAIGLTRRLAEALDYAHRQGVIHRDIKPENILLHDGQPLIADFGIALAFSEAGGTRLTETGLSLGTPRYMSPEQAMGDRQLDARCDVYALGVVLYELLVGETPFTGGTGQAIVARILTEPVPPLATGRPTVPPNVAAAVHTALAKLPADRFPTATAFAEALADASFRRDLPAGVPEGGRMARTVHRRLIPAGVAAGLACVALGAGVAWWLYPEPAPPAAARFLVRTPDSVRWVGRCCGSAMTLSPDGRELVYVARVTSGAWHLFRRPLSRLTNDSIPGTGDASVPFFSPNGAWVGFASGGALKKVSLAGGPPITIADDIGELFGASWGEDDVILFALRGDSALWSIPASGGEPVIVAAPGSAGVRYRHPEVLPGGEHALLTIIGPGDVRIGVVSLDDGTVRALGRGTEAGYAHPGHLMYTRGDRSLLVQPFDPDAARTTGPAVVLLNDVARPGIVGEFAVSRTGIVTYLLGRGGFPTGSGERLVWVRRDGAVREMLDPGEYEGVRISPDGGRVAITVGGSSPEGVPDVWVVHLEQGAATRLTFDGGSAPVWTPDGRWIVFFSERDGAPGLYRTRADGSGQVEQLLATERLVGALDVTADGRVFVILQEGNTQRAGGIFTFAPEDGGEPEPYLVTRFTEVQAALSPDDRWLAYTSDLSGQPEVYVSAFPDRSARWQISTDGGQSPRWSPDGGELYYWDGRSNLIAATVVGGREFGVVSRDVVFQMTGIDLNVSNSNYDVHPDGAGFLAIRVAGAGADQWRPVLHVITNWWAELERIGGPGS